MVSLAEHMLKTEQNEIWKIPYKDEWEKCCRKSWIFGGCSIHTNKWAAMLSRCESQNVILNVNI